jgi:hypothetical protein
MYLASSLMGKNSANHVLLQLPIYLLNGTSASIQMCAVPERIAKVNWIRVPRKIRQGEEGRKGRRDKSHVIYRDGEYELLCAGDKLLVGHIYELYEFFVPTPHW